MKHADIVRKLSKKYKIDTRIIDLVIKSPFLFMRDKIHSLDDIRALRLPFFGTIAYKSIETQQRKQLMLIKEAARRLKELKDKDTSEEFKKGVDASLGIIEELIIERYSDPEKYGIIKIPHNKRTKDEEDKN